MGKIGVVFSNLGTPKSSHPKDVARYLREFLMDPHVIDIPFVPRWFLVNVIIAPFRSKKSGKNYEKVWMKEGSPLLIYTEKAAELLQEKLGNGYKVVVAMRYGEPSFLNAREKLKDCDQVILFQQYPQFADSTTTTGEEHFKKIFKDVSYKIIPPYYSKRVFIKAYGDFLREKLKTIEFDHLLMSFHGLPESHIVKADPTGQHCLKTENCCEKSDAVINKCYRAQCFATARSLAQELNLPHQNYSVSFQSRLGKQKWIEPYTEDMYKILSERGVKKLAVICPGFSVDGLETLEEIAIGGKQSFLARGGESFTFVPCLNSDPQWIDACVDLLQEG